MHSHTASARSVHPRLASLLAWAVPLLLTLACLNPAQAARLALVIGNKDYTVGALKNPLNDADDMALALAGPGGLGFAVTLVKNLKRDDIGRTVEGFASRIRPGDDVVVFYAGHGLQVKGVNYLPAVDARIAVEGDVALNSLNLNELLLRLDEAKAGVRLLLVDACRDNPYSRGFRSNTRGLARVEGAPSGTLMHFATRPGGVADDGPGRNGLYTSELLKHLRTPGLQVESLLKRVASGVRAASGGAQQPWSEGALDGEFFFVEERPVVAVAPPPVSNPKPPPVSAPSSPTVGPTTPAPASVPVLAASRPLPAPSAVPAAPVPVASAVAAGAPPKPGTVLKDCPQCPELVVVPPGQFLMGSPVHEADRQSNEGPVRKVNIAYPLAIGRFEVRRGEFAAFVADAGYVTESEAGVGCRAHISGFTWNNVPDRHWRNPGFDRTDDHPVVCVTWRDIQSYLKWLNAKQPGKSYRLLSEQEWEYAARAGQGDARFPWGNDFASNQLCDHANGADWSAQQGMQGLSPTRWLAQCKDGYAFTAPVGQFKANAFGLYDMIGNVYEQVEDEWHDSFDGSPLDGSVWRAGGDASKRVVRGGSFEGTPSRLRTAYRGGGDLVGPTAAKGFRIARAL